MALEIDWNTIAARLGPRLYSYFHRRGFFMQAADLTQETLLRLLEKVEGNEFDPDLGRLEQYAFGIARFVGMEQSKKSAESWANVDYLQLAEEEKLEGNLQRQQHAKALRAAIQELSEVQREVLWLILDEDLKLEEVAMIMEVPLGTVKSHVHRAKEQLKMKLNKIWESI